MTRLFKIAALSLSVLVPSFIVAAPYQLKVTAEVSDIYGTMWDSSIALGTTMTALFTFDSSVPSIYADATKEGYFFSGLTSSISVGDYNVTSTSGNQLWIYDNDPSFDEGYQFDAFSPDGLPTSYYNFMGGRLWSTDFSLLNNTSQPIQQFDATVFNINSLFIGGFADAGGSADVRQEITGRVVSYEVQSVPEGFSPGAALGVLFLAMTFIRSRHTANA